MYDNAVEFDQFIDQFIDELRLWLKQYGGWILTAFVLTELCLAIGAVTGILPRILVLLPFGCIVGVFIFAVLVVFEVAVVQATMQAPLETASEAVIPFDPQTDPTCQRYCAGVETSMCATTSCPRYRSQTA
jgi:hypothetical protein